MKTTMALRCMRWHCPAICTTAAGPPTPERAPIVWPSWGQKNMGNSPKDRIHPTKPWFLIQFLPTLWTSNGFLICLAFFSWCFTFFSWVHIPWWTAKRAVVFSYSTKLLPLVATFGIWGINMVMIWSHVQLGLEVASLCGLKHLHKAETPLHGCDTFQ